MEFARKQLEKWGWKDGNGLGREMQGMSVALKPRLKTGKEGMGFDLCKELTDTWWTKAYSDSLSRLQVDLKDQEGEVVVRVQEYEGEGKKAKKKGNKRTLLVDDEEERPMEKMRKRMMKANFTTFSKGGTLLTNGDVVEDPKTKEDLEKAERKAKEEKIKVLSDEELLKACGGRTAHKAARFGLKLNGKLARIAAQEAIDVATLTSYSSSKGESSSSTNASESEEKPRKDKKKRKKDKERERRNRQLTEDDVEELLLEPEPEVAAEVESEELSKNKRKKKKKSKTKVDDIDSNDGSR